MCLLPERRKTSASTYSSNRGLNSLPHIRWSHLALFALINYMYPNWEMNYLCKSSDSKMYKYLTFEKKQLNSASTSGTNKCINILSKRRKGLARTSGSISGINTESRLRAPALQALTWEKKQGSWRGPFCIRRKIKVI